ncbi:MAG: hypothetical protein U0946_03320 [Patescibacteria group bacterium]|nr:hypothetical protein [Patescibacteria group bacterium]
MLTKTDLSKIKKVVRDEVVSESKNTNLGLRSEIKLSRMQIQDDLVTLSDRVKNLEQQSRETGKDVKKIRKNIDIIIDSFDRENLSLNRRVARVETHLQLKPLADF